MVKPHSVSQSEYRGKKKEELGEDVWNRIEADRMIEVRARVKATQTAEEKERKDVLARARRKKYNDKKAAEKLAREGQGPVQPEQEAPPVEAPRAAEAPSAAGSGKGTPKRKLPTRSCQKKERVQPGRPTRSQPEPEPEPAVAESVVASARLKAPKRQQGVVYVSSGTDTDDEDRHNEASLARQLSLKESSSAPGVSGKKGKGKGKQSTTSTPSTSSRSKRRRVESDKPAAEGSQEKIVREMQSSGARTPRKSRLYYRLRKEKEARQYSQQAVARLEQKLKTIRQLFKERRDQPSEQEMSDPQPTPVIDSPVATGPLEVTYTDFLSQQTPATCQPVVPQTPDASGAVEMPSTDVPAQSTTPVQATLQSPQHRRPSPVPVVAHTPDASGAVGSPSSGVSEERTTPVLPRQQSTTPTDPSQTIGAHTPVVPSTAQEITERPVVSAKSPESDTSVQKKKAELYECFVSNMAKLAMSEKREVLSKITSPEDVKSLRGASSLARDLKMDRRTLVMPRSKRRPSVKFSTARVKVVEFLKRPDNSVTLPGKKDCITIRKVKKQKVQLTEFLQVLHVKYNNEHVANKVSFSFFASVRRQNPYILPVQCNTTLVCLCIRHQNFTLKLKAVRSVGLPALPDTLVRDWDATRVCEALEAIPAVVQYQNWKRVVITYGDGQTTKKVRLVEEVQSRVNFTRLFLSDMALMTEHVKRCHAQYSAVHSLKEHMSGEECSVQMDFSENWMISYPNQPQSVYYSKEPVTVHPVVLHYQRDGSINHESLVLVSDDRKHDSGAVFAFIKVIVDHIKSNLPAIKNVHYLTDGPTSQYRNVSCFSVVAKHEELFGVKGSWLYFEAGHGKGACDGIGAAAKRMADLSVKREHLLQNAADFVSAGNESNTNMKYVEVTCQAINESRSQLADLVCQKSVPGTMKTHAVVCPNPGCIAIRSTSCYNTCCVVDGRWILGCPGWVKHTLFAPPADTLEAEEESTATEEEAEHVTPEEQESTATEEEAEHVTPEERSILSAEQLNSGAWVAALYDQHWYLGEIVSVNAVDQECVINFMGPQSGQECVNKFRWPARKDQLDVPCTDILAVVSAPKEVGQGRRKHFIMEEHDIMAVTSMYKVAGPAI